MGKLNNLTYRLKIDVCKINTVEEKAQMDTQWRRKDKPADNVVMEK